MNKYIATLIAFFISSIANGDEYQCGEHKNRLSVISTGSEHVNHSVRLNGKKSIQEIETEMWFVESVTCTNQGFKIIASHAQYNEPTEKTFNLSVSDSWIYEIE